VVGCVTGTLQKAEATGLRMESYRYANVLNMLENRSTEQNITSTELLSRIAWSGDSAPDTMPYL